MKVRIRDRRAFNNVFGADCFLKWWPELLTTGVPVKREEGHGSNGRSVFYFIFDPATGKKVNDTAFFTGKEMRCMERIEEPLPSAQVDGTMIASTNGEVK